MERRGSLIRVERGGPVVRVTLSRVEQRNSVSTEMLEELIEALGGLAADRETRVVVLAGDGPDFCAGADFAELEVMRSGPGEFDYGRSFEELLQAIANHPVPVIARVHGAALGAGCQIAVACDLAVVAEDAKIGIPSARLGILINFENIQRLVLAVGPKRAGEMLFTGRAVDGVHGAAWAWPTSPYPRTSSTRRWSGWRGPSRSRPPCRCRAPSAASGWSCRTWRWTGSPRGTAWPTST